jgi:hypothetical protein
MSMFDSHGNRTDQAIFSESDDEAAETDPFLSRSKIDTTHGHITGSSIMVTSQSTTTLPPQVGLQEDHFSSSVTTADSHAPYSTPTRNPLQTRRSYESPAADPWSTTPRTNGAPPVTAPTLPPRISSIQGGASTGGETASYLLDADHINIQKTDEKEGLIGFKHVNYTLASARRGTQVVRRYSDFAW